MSSGWNAAAEQVQLSPLFQALREKLCEAQWELEPEWDTKGWLRTWVGSEMLLKRSDPLARLWRLGRTLLGWSGRAQNSVLERVNCGTGESVPSRSSKYKGHEPWSSLAVGWKAGQCAWSQGWGTDWLLGGEPRDGLWQNGEGLRQYWQIVSYSQVKANGETRCHWHFGSIKGQKELCQRKRMGQGIVAKE